jgi:hypothetical protein
MHNTRNAPRSKFTDSQLQGVVGTTLAEYTRFENRAEDDIAFDQADDL